MHYHPAMIRATLTTAAVVAVLGLAAPAHAIGGGPDGSSCNQATKPVEKTSWYTDPPSAHVTYKGGFSYTKSACVTTTGRWAVTYHEAYEYRVVRSAKSCDLYEREAVGFGAPWTRWSWQEDQPPVQYCS